MSYADEAIIRENIVPLNRALTFRREPYATLKPSTAPALVKGLIPATGFGFLAGASQSRKSFLALEWSLRIAAGQPVLGHRSKQGGVVYVAAEGADGLRKRVAAWREHRGAPDLPFDLIGQAADLRNPVHIGALIESISGAKADLAANGEELRLVVIDTLSASMPGGDENNSADMSATLANVQKIGSETGAFVLVVSHTGKDEGRGIRGWSGQYANADLVVMLSRNEEAGLSEGVVKKLKDGEDGERFAFKLESVGLGVDEDGDAISSCVVAYEDVPEARQGRRPRPLRADYQTLLKAVEAVTDGGPTVPLPQSIPGAQSWQKAVSRGDVKARALAIGFLVEEEKPDALRQRFSRGLQELSARGLIRMEGDLVWLLGSVTA
jgi:hypothetical protein